MTTFARGQRVIGAATHYVDNQPPWRVDVDEYSLNAPSPTNQTEPFSVSASNASVGA